ncbi:hypothetical protein [Alcaligenes aquatilis]|uniref:hypothetical protein n=1 Tax=Alcaligenes aquatilis TaxID=323284 RepID=UPI000D52AFB4|nr:hypothetical protein [Alcaligenes aquatilis]AWG34429.1 hypothetical protein CA948_04510 [Alcaligenes aquatilis]
MWPSIASLPVTAVCVDAEADELLELGVYTVFSSATSPAVMRQAWQEASAYRRELLALDIEDAMLACQIYALWSRSVVRNLSMADILIMRCLSLLPVA